MDSKASGWGLVVCGGEAPEPADLALIASRCTRVVAADGGLLHALAAGIQVDVCVGDMDSFPGEAPAGLVIQRYPRDKDRSDTWLAIQTLLSQGVEKVCIAGGGGGRMDHLLSIKAALIDFPGVMRWYTAHDEVLVVREYLEVPVTAGMVLSFFSLGGDAMADSRGLRWPLDGLVLGSSFHSLSNEATDTTVELMVHRGAVLMIRKREPGILFPFGNSAAVSDCLRD